MSEFIKYPKISKKAKLKFSITEKLHGTNAQVFIYRDEEGALQLKCGSRNRWVTPDNDNYGFATFVYPHKEEFIKTLGEGRHYGEWIGPGINSGCGVDEKLFVLFDWYRFPEGRPMPPSTKLVKVLYSGKIDLDKLKECSDLLINEGSQFQPGFMRPEGLVADINGDKFKVVFNPEETQWTTPDKTKVSIPREVVDYTHLCQPLRLSNVVTKDEQLTLNFPKSLKTICDLYVKDLIEEEQVTEDEFSVIRKSAVPQIFKFIKKTMEEL